MVFLVTYFPLVIITGVKPDAVCVKHDPVCVCVCVCVWWFV